MGIYINGFYIEDALNFAVCVFVFISAFIQEDITDKNLCFKQHRVEVLSCNSICEVFLLQRCHFFSTPVRGRERTSQNMNFDFRLEPLTTFFSKSCFKYKCGEKDFLKLEAFTCIFLIL